MKPFELDTVIARHVAEHIGEPEVMFARIVPGDPPIRVFCVAPREERPAWTLVTSGISAVRALPPPHAAHDARGLELVLCLPESWSPPSADADEPWQITLLHDAASVVGSGAWLDIGHTLASADPPSAFAADTELCAAIVSPQRLAPDGFAKFEVDGDTVSVLALLPIFREELAFAEQHGGTTLLERMWEAGIDEYIDEPARSNLLA